jgi:gas vesicle protein
MSKGKDSLITFLAGAAVGVVLGVLYAPDKGKNTRDKLSFQLEKYREKLKELVDEMMEEKETPETAAKSEGRKIVNDAKDKAEKLLSDVEMLIDQIRTKK